MLFPISKCVWSSLTGDILNPCFTRSLNAPFTYRLNPSPRFHVITISCHSLVIRSVARSQALAPVLTRNVASYPGCTLIPLAFPHLCLSQCVSFCTILICHRDLSEMKWLLSLEQLLGFHL